MPYGIVLHTFPVMSYTDRNMRATLAPKYISNLHVVNIVQYGIFACSNSVY